MKFLLYYTHTHQTILETTEVQSTSPIQTSKHTKVRNEITAFSTFLNAIRKNFYNIDVSQNTKHDLQKKTSMVYNRLFHT